MLKTQISTVKSGFLCFVVGDSTDHSGRPGQGRGAAGSQRSHEEPEDPPGAPDVLSGRQLPDYLRRFILIPSFTK